MDIYCTMYNKCEIVNDKISNGGGGQIKKQIKGKLNLFMRKKNVM